MAKRRDERPAFIVTPNYEETMIAQNPGVAEDNVERKRFDRNSKKQRESEGKRMIQRLKEENGRNENTALSTWFALQTQQPKSVKILNLHTGIQQLAFSTKMNYPSSPVRKVLTVSPKNYP